MPRAWGLGKASKVGRRLRSSHEAREGGPLRCERAAGLAHWADPVSCLCKAPVCAGHLRKGAAQLFWGICYTVDNCPQWKLFSISFAAASAFLEGLRVHSAGGQEGVGQETPSHLELPATSMNTAF